jgi:hypothetical protein
MSIGVSGLRSSEEMKEVLVVSRGSARSSPLLGRRAARPSAGLHQALAHAPRRRGPIESSMLRRRHVRAEATALLHPLAAGRHALTAVH